MMDPQKRTEVLEMLVRYYLRREDFSLDCLGRQIPRMAKDVGVGPADLADVILPLILDELRRIVEKLGCSDKES